MSSSCAPPRRTSQPASDALLARRRLASLSGSSSYLLSQWGRWGWRSPRRGHGASRGRVQGAVSGHRRRRGDDVGDPGRRGGEPYRVHPGDRAHATGIARSEVELDHGRFERGRGWERDHERQCPSGAQAHPYASGCRSGYSSPGSWSETRGRRHRGPEKHADSADDGQARVDPPRQTPVTDGPSWMNGGSVARPPNQRRFGSLARDSGVREGSTPSGGADRHGPSHSTPPRGCDHCRALPSRGDGVRPRRRDARRMSAASVSIMRPISAPIVSIPRNGSFAPVRTRSTTPRTAP